MKFSERIQLAVSLAVDGDPYPLIELYQNLTQQLGHAVASDAIQRYGAEVFG